MNPFFQTELGRLYCGDCLEITPQLTEKAALICIDPPYNINKDSWDKIPDYQAWMGKVFLECQRLLKDNGSFYWFHNKMPVIARLMGWIEENTDFIFKKFIVWDKWNNNKFQMGNGLQGAFYKIIHNPALRNYPQMAEYCLFYTFQDETGLSKIQGDCVYPIREYLRKEILRAKRKIVFKEINQILGTADNGGGVASACLSEKKTIPAVITKEHYLKLRAWLNQDNSGEYLRREYEELRYTFHQFNNQTSIWSYHIPSGKERVNHPTQKPVALIENIIKHSSNPGDLVEDYFGGIGTTAVACENLKRKWILIEKSERYCEIGARRIEEVSSQMSF